ncbi:MAG: response regulator [Chthoniobacteraceae bacterium]|nr:response regulator [Chthoniobacteraceae bacterium]
MSPPAITVLLIDDEPAQAWLVTEHLRSISEKSGKPVGLVHTESLHDGFQRLEEGDIDALLLDLSLPDSIGLETLTKAHAKFPAMPIVVLTSLEDEELGIRLVQNGAQDYLVKGQVDGLLLLRTLRYAIERKQDQEEREQLIQDLQGALAQVKTLSGLLPICSGCKKIRDDQGYWNRIETYISEHSEAQFSHGICPDCAKKYFPDYKAYLDGEHPEPPIQREGVSNTPPRANRNLLS